MSTTGLDTRRALRSDAAAMAAAHRDSIESLGPAFYPPAAIDTWLAAVSPALYLDAMDRGEIFFIATDIVGGQDVVLGFSSEYRSEGSTHGISVYVRGSAARHGLGSALLRLAEAHAVEQGATCIQIDASLSGVDFYKTHGYRELRRSEVCWATGGAVACVVMCKQFA